MTACGVTDKMELGINDTTHSFPAELLAGQTSPREQRAREPGPLLTRAAALGTGPSEDA